MTGEIWTYVATKPSGLNVVSVIKPTKYKKYQEELMFNFINSDILVINDFSLIFFSYYLIIVL